MNCIKTACIVALYVVVAASAHAAPGLLLVAHGSPSPDWNKPILELGDKVREKAMAQGDFRAVRTGFLEFAKPDIPGAVAELESEGCDRIVVVPLLIAPSGHSHFDIPAALGIYGSREVRAMLATEGGATATPKIPIVVTPTLSEGDILATYALDQVKALSTAPKEEALVLVAHGDPDHHGLNERLMRRIVTYCCGHGGIDYADWAFVGMGQTYAAEALPAFQRAEQKKQRVLVVGLYVATSAKQLHERAMKAGNVHGAPSEDGARLVLSKQAVINTPGVVDWVVQNAKAAVSP